MLSCVITVSIGILVFMEKARIFYVMQTEIICKTANKDSRQRNDKIGDPIGVQRCSANGVYQNAGVHSLHKNSNGLCHTANRFECGNTREQR